MKKQTKTVSIIAITIFSFSILCALAFAVLVVRIYSEINFEADEKLFENSRVFESTLFYADGGNGEEYEPVLVETSGNVRKNNYSLDEISPYIKRGFIAVEDKIFYQHKGIDLKRTIMASVNYITKREKTFGASTITQQVIKNISGDNQLKVKRKIGEIIRAIHIEKNFSKDEILELYLNVIPMSGQIYGVGAASRAYFGKEPSDLAPEEAATLIGITNAPTAYSPYLNPEACLKKRNIVLGVMLEDGVITEEQYKLAIKTPLNVIPKEKQDDRFDSWYVETAIEEICSDLSKKYDISLSAARMMLMKGGYKIYTAMDISVQERLEEYFENTDNLALETGKGLNYAMTVTDSKTGDLVGIIGRAGRKEANRLQNHALIPHTPASALKPLALYAPLIDNGSINWASVFDDVPVSFIGNNDELRPYPKNSPDIYDGLTTVKDAVRLSKNTVAVRLCNMLTPKNVFLLLRDKFGFNTLIEKEGNITDIALAPMALGQLGRGVSLLKLTEGYSVFPGDGVRKEARSYLYVLDHNNEKILFNEKNEERVFKESTARIMNKLLMNVTESGTAGKITLKNQIDLAGKTGTSGGNKDKIFIGYTPIYTAGIWCGYDNGDSITSMSKSQLEIWDEVMTKIHDNLSEKESFPTEGLMYLPYCMDSGKEYSENCLYDPRGCRREFGYFTEDNRPMGKCDKHIVCLYDSETKAIANEGCPKENLVAVSLISVTDRAFPIEMTITDAEYVYRSIGRYTERPIDYALPYFWEEIPEGVYVGRSKGRKQFNSNCYLHDD